MCLCFPHLCSCVPTTLSHTHTNTHTNARMSPVWCFTLSRDQRSLAPRGALPPTVFVPVTTCVCAWRVLMFLAEPAAPGPSSAPPRPVSFRAGSGIKTARISMRKPQRLRARVSKMVPEPLVKGPSGSRGNTGLVVSAEQDVCLPR